MRALTTLAFLVLLGGCERGVDSTSEGSPSAESPPASSGSAASSPPVAPSAKPLTGKVTDAAAFAALLESDREATLRRIGEFEYTAHRKLLTVSGLDAELGGPERADAALRALMLEMKRITLPWQTPRWTRVQNRATSDGALGVAQAVVELASVSLDFKSLYGDGKADKGSHKTAHGEATIEIGDGSIEYGSTNDVEAGGLAGKFETRMKVNLCPDPAGKVTLEATSKSSLSRAGGSGTNITIRTIVVRTLSDEADYVDNDTQTHVEHASFGGNAGTFVDMDISSPAVGAASQRVNRRSSQASDGDVQNAADLAKILELMAVQYTELARGVWERGKCVRLEPTTTPTKRTRAKPSTSFSVLAAPRSRVDGGPVGGTVTATLNGESSLDPAGSKVRSDAKFTYVGPDEKKKQASVNFEARSKRGIGKADLPFDTNEGAAYSAKGGADEFVGTGEICDLAAPFTIAGSGNTVTFVPGDANGGTYTYAGTMSGFAVYGNGTYTVKYADDVAVSITAIGPGSVKTPAGVMSRTGTEQYQLTPMDGGCGD
jgi:hypothetical protein